MKEIIKVISKKYILIAVGPTNCIWFRNGKIWISKDIDYRDIREAGNLLEGKRTNIRNFIASHSKTIQRVLRMQPRSCVRTAEGYYCFAFNQEIIILDEQGRLLHRSTIRPEMRNPLQIQYIQGIKGFDDGLVYGEYGWNDEKGKVNIVRFTGEEWKPVYTFAPNTITHIHGLIPDHERQCIYILTGDQDNESGIWKATDNFLNVEPVIIGKQKYRSCAAIIRNGRIIYATDTPIENNYLLETDFKNEPKVICELPGTVINSYNQGDNWWLATAVEQDPNLPKLLHYISSRIGPGIRDRYTHLFCITRDLQIKEVIKFKKDILPMWLFQFGNVSFVNNYRDKRVFVIPMSVKRYSQKTVEIVEK